MNKFIIFVLSLLMFFSNFNCHARGGGGGAAFGGAAVGSLLGVTLATAATRSSKQGSGGISYSDLSNVERSIRDDVTSDLKNLQKRLEEILNEIEKRLKKRLSDLEKRIGELQRDIYKLNAVD